MTSTSPASPSSAPVLLSGLVKHAVLDAKGKSVGELADAVVRLRGHHYPLLTGFVARVGSLLVYVPMARVTSIGPDRIELRSAKLDLRPFARRHGEVLLREDVLGHRLIDVDRARLVRAYDVQLSDSADGWVVSGLDVHQRRWLHWGSRHQQHPLRDWRSFEALIGHQASWLVRSPSGRLRRLRPAQIADLIEQASRTEQQELLDQVHADPELEADVFEELDDDQQAELLRDRSSDQVAQVLGNMRADDAVDALMELPQERRVEVLELLPEPQRTKVRTLLGYNTATAGGLMGVDFLTVIRDSTVKQALTALRDATTKQPEALTTIYVRDDDDRLVGALGLVQALQLDPSVTLGEAAEREPVRVLPDDDIIEVARCMADFNLLTLPVVDDQERILGVITVDDVLEATIPENWLRREGRNRATHHPDGLGEHISTDPT